MEPLSERIPASLPAATAAVAAVLRWPHNIGIEFRPLRLATQPATDLLIVFVHGLADEELLRLWVTEPLQRAAARQPAPGRLTPGNLGEILPAPRLETVDQLDAAIQGVLAGAAALFLDGAAAAVLVHTEGPVERPVGASLVPEDPFKELFADRLVRNVALIRKRLRDPALVAEPLELPQGRAAAAALVYLDGRADPQVLRRVRRFLAQRAGEEAIRRGLGAGQTGLLGLLPDLLGTVWPDKVAVLLDAGYVAALVDRQPVALLAPVTAPAALYAPGDDHLRRPVAVLLRFFRVCLCLLVLLAPATVVAFLNYHQEMIPTPFLLGLAASRENAALPIVAEVLGLELLQEMIREATIRLPVRITPGNSLIGSILLMLIMVQAGLAGALPAMVSTLATLAMFGIPSYDLIYMIRIWRFPVIAGAAIFGLAGVAAVTFLFVAYLCQAESFGVPFIPETGVRFTAPGRSASRRL